ncbi:hypothetical protein CSB09_02330, partial [Candidatus Gracilibacteria bacterium]
ASLFLPRILFLLSAKEKRKSEGFHSPNDSLTRSAENTRKILKQVQDDRKSHPEERSDVAICVMMKTEEIAALRSRGRRKKKPQKHGSLVKPGMKGREKATIICHSCAGRNPFGEKGTKEEDPESSSGGQGKEIAALPSRGRRKKKPQKPRDPETSSGGQRPKSPCPSNIPLYKGIRYTSLL